MVMKKILVISACGLLVLSSCGTYTGAGAYAGGSFGSIIGSAIGGIAGGRHGSDIGTLIGMAGGAAVGAAVGSAADRTERQQYEEYRSARQQRSSQYDDRRYDRTYDDGHYVDETNSGDDRLYGFGDDLSSSVTSAAVETPAIEIRNPRLIDANRDGVLMRGEQLRMVFEVFNNSDKPLYQIQPTVAEITSNRHIRVSQNVLVESIQPGKGIRYTAVIKADDRLKDGEAVFRISVLHRNKEVTSQTREFSIETRKQ